MNKKANSSYLLILVIVSTVLAVWSFMSKPKATYQLQDLQKKRQLKASLWDGYVSLIIDNDDKRLDSNSSLIDSSGKKFSLKDVVNDSVQLVFQYSYKDCDVCIDAVVASLDSISKRLNFGNVLLITRAYTERDFALNVGAKKVPLKIYNLQNDVGLSIENKNLPFLYVLSKDLKASRFFIPTKEFPELTVEYILKVIELIQHEQNS